ncbi:MAG: 4Fe-4S binding protein, partial [Desulfobacterales bacterium]
EKAVDIVHGANRSGLMQSAELGLNDRGRPTGAICNCCPDCCFPHLLSQHLKVETVWPKSRYIARPKPSRCTRCGRCARRCPFHALRIEKAKRDVSPRLIYHEERCRGCGICAAGCPDQAIFMEKTRGLEAWEPEHLLNGY